MQLVISPAICSGRGVIWVEKTGKFSGLRSWSLAELSRVHLPKIGYEQPGEHRLVDKVVQVTRALGLIVLDQTHIVPCRPGDCRSRRRKSSSIYHSGPCHQMSHHVSVREIPRSPQKSEPPLKAFDPSSPLLHELFDSKDDSLVLYICRLRMHTGVERPRFLQEFVVILVDLDTEDVADGPPATISPVFVRP